MNQKDIPLALFLTFLPSIFLGMALEIDSRMIIGFVLCSLLTAIFSLALNDF